MIVIFIIYQVQSQNYSDFTGNSENLPDFYGNYRPNIRQNIRPNIRRDPA